MSNVQRTSQRIFVVALECAEATEELLVVHEAIGVGVKELKDALTWQITVPNRVKSLPVCPLLTVSACSNKVASSRQRLTSLNCDRSVSRPPQMRKNAFRSLRNSPMLTALRGTCVCQRGVRCAAQQSTYSLFRPREKPAMIECQGDHQPHTPVLLPVQQTNKRPRWVSLCNQR